MCLAPNRIFEAACSNLSEFQQNFPMHTTKPLPGVIKWRPPSSDIYKANFDGAVFEDSDEAGIGL